LVLGLIKVKKKYGKKIISWGVLKNPGFNKKIV